MPRSLIGGETVETINARDLHKFLEVRSKFSDWISRRIKEVAGLEYYISIDMLAMVERNEKGRQARRYFIECQNDATADEERDLALETYCARYGEARPDWGVAFGSRRLSKP